MNEESKISNYEDNKEKLSNLSKRIEELEKENKLHEKILKSHDDLLKNILFKHDLKPKGLLKDIQNLETELISFIDNVCTKYNLEYWLDYGTLLGAKRHEGFIPWDDDTDLGMMREDFEKIFPLLKKEVNEKNLNNIDVNIYHQNNKNILISFIQFIYRHPTYKNAMGTLDIFPCDYRKTSEIISKKDFLDYRQKFHMQLLNNKKPEKVINNYFNQFELTYEKTEFILIGVESWYGLNGDELNIETETIFPLKNIKFNGKTLKALIMKMHY